MTNHVIFDNKTFFELGVEGNIINKLPNGIYNAVEGPFGRRFITPVILETDKIINLEKSNTEKVMKDIELFLSSGTKQAFDNYELLYRRGILLYGPPGTGKTSTVIRICREFIKKHNGVVFLDFGFNSIGEWIRDIRAKDAKRPVLLVIEEIDNALEYHESEILSLLDGEASIDNLIVLATTNYIEEIPSRIKNRPSRFSTIIEIGYPEFETRLAFLQSRILADDQKKVNISKLAQETEGFSIDHLKDLIVTVFCFGLPPDVAIQKLKIMIENDSSTEEE